MRNNDALSSANGICISNWPDFHLREPRMHYSETDGEQLYENIGNFVAVQKFNQRKYTFSPCTLLCGGLGVGREINGHGCGSSEDGPQFYKENTNSRKMQLWLLWHTICLLVSTASVAFFVNAPRTIIFIRQREHHGRL